jgi:head-tail adaptor
VAFTALIKDSFTPQTMAYTDDGMGGFTETLTSGTAFPGRLSRLSAAERFGPDKTTVIATHKLYCDASVTLTEQGRVTLGSRTFEIKGIQLPSNLSSGIGHQEVTVMEID